MMLSNVLPQCEILEYQLRYHLQNKSIRLLNNIIKNIIVRMLF